MHKIKVTQVGNSLGIVLSKELLERLRITKGDTLYWNETPTGIELSPYDPEFADQMKSTLGKAQAQASLLK